MLAAAFTVLFFLHCFFLEQWASKSQQPPPVKQACSNTDCNQTAIEWPMLEESSWIHLTLQLRTNLEQAAQGPVHFSFEYLQGWRRHKLSGQPVLMFDYCPEEKNIPESNQNIPYCNLCVWPAAISSCNVRSLPPPSLQSPTKYLRHHYIPPKTSLKTEQIQLHLCYFLHAMATTSLKDEANRGQTHSENDHDGVLQETWGMAQTSVAKQLLQNAISNSSWIHYSNSVIKESLLKDFWPAAYWMQKASEYKVIKYDRRGKGCQLNAGVRHCRHIINYSVHDDIILAALNK